ncbi:MAG: hypothetical protein AAFN68_01840 [Pseudomonadota bacterium]
MSSDSDPSPANKTVTNSQQPQPQTPPSRLSGLAARLRGDERSYLRRFVVGAALFFSGLGIVLYAEQKLLASLGQELLAATGLVLSIVGGLTALLGYIALSFSRIFKLTKKDD